MPKQKGPLSFTMSVHVDAKQGWNYELIVMYIPSKIDDGFSNFK